MNIYFFFSKKFFIVFLFALGLTTGLVLFSKKQGNRTPFTLAHDYRPHHHSSYLEEQEKNIWKQLTSLGCDYKTCMAKKNELALSKNIYTTASRQTVSLKTIDLINQVLDDFALDKGLITIKPWDNGSPAAATNNTLFINDKALKKFKKSTQKFIIGHELQHIIYEDYLIKWAQECVTKDKKIEQSSIAPLLDSYSRFTEERADIQTALKNSTYAQGFVDFMTILMHQEGDDYNPGTSHPKNSTRLQMASTIFQSQYA